MIHNRIQLRLGFHLHGREVASGDKIGVIAVGVLPLRLPAIPVRNRLALENINNRTADGRKVFGAVIGPSGNTSEIGELRVPSNERVLGRGDTVPEMKEF